jgi:ADP-heptose:LPS heptosyltransferase
MKVSTMRRIDAWIGIPLCLIASVLRKVFGRSVAADHPKSVLIIKLSELGALVMLGPAMASLTRLVGRQNLHFLTFSENRGLLEILDYVPRENIFTLRTDSPADLAADALYALLKLRQKRIDCSLDLDFFSRATALLGWLSGCRRRVGCHAYFGEGPYRGDLLTHRLKFNPHIHVSQMFEILADAVQKPAGHFPRVEFIPAPADAIRRRFQPGTVELAAIEHMLDEVGAGPQDTLVLLNSNISDRESIPLRKWPDEHYVELAKLIVAGTPNSFVLLTGGAREAESIAGLEARIGQPWCRCVAGKTTLRELLTLYTRSAMLITNDSGPAHFATLTDIEVVVLFGPETPMLWRPLGDRVRVIYRGLGCSPCFSVYNGRQSACRRNVCMEIAPAEVYEVVRKRLAERRERLQGSWKL